jgi:hypothetical protein
MGKKLAVVFIGIHICGMHHYGRSRFDIGESFHLRREPDNKHDANSIAVLDEGRTVAHINGCDAAKLAPIGLLDSGFVKGTVFYKVKHEAEVKSKRQGPEHSGTVGFHYEEARRKELETVINSSRLQVLWLNA